MISNLENVISKIFIYKLQILATTTNQTNARRNLKQKTCEFLSTFTFCLEIENGQLNLWIVSPHFIRIPIRTCLDGIFRSNSKLLQLNLFFRPTHCDNP